ncbi:hypothetical protein ACVLV4_000412 [Rathayibacter agropyri]
MRRPERMTQLARSGVLTGNPLFDGVAGAAKDDPPDTRIFR